MKTSNKKTHAFERAAAFITAALIALTLGAALTFTACPNNAGGGGGGSTVNITVKGDANVNVPAEPVGVRAGAKWSEAQSTVKSKVSAKPNFLIDSWHLGADESAPELKDTDTFYTNATVFVKSRPDLPDLSSIQGSGEQVKITFEVTPEEGGAILGPKSISVNKGTPWNSVLKAYAKAALKEHYGFKCNGWKKNGNPVNDTYTFDDDTTIFAELEDLRINITVKGDGNVSVPDSTPLVVLSGRKWQDIKEQAANRVQVSDPSNIAVTAWHRGESESAPVLTDEYEFKKADGQNRTVFAKTGDRRITLTVTYGPGSGTPTTAGTITIYDGDEWHNVQKQAEKLVTVPEDHSIHWYWDNAGGEFINDSYTFKASDGNERTVYAKVFDKHITLTVTYGRITGATVTLGTVTTHHRKLWYSVQNEIKRNNPLLSNTEVEWHWNDKTGEILNDDYVFDAGNVPSHTVYAFVRPRIITYYGGLRYIAPIGSGGSYEDYNMQKTEAVTDGTVGGDDEPPHNFSNNVHKVSLTAYQIGTTEVTQELYELVMANNPSHFQGSSHPPASGEWQEKRPVEQVSWFDAIAFCNELTRCCYSLGEAQCVYTYNGHTYTVEDAQDKKVPVMDMSKKGFRLPTEAEWEWAAQGGTARQKWAGTNDENKLKEYAWYGTNSGKKTHQVRSLKKSPFGLFDMSGNVWEWCWDWYSYPLPDSSTDPTGPSSAHNRIIRGGSYFNNFNSDIMCYCYFRYVQEPAEKKPITGFRIVCRYEF